MAASTEPCCGDLPATTAMLLSATAFQNTTELVEGAERSTLESLSHRGTRSLCAKAKVAVKTVQRYAFLIITLLLVGDAGTSVGRKRNRVASLKTGAYGKFRIWKSPKSEPWAILRNTS